MPDPTPADDLDASRPRSVAGDLLDDELEPDSPPPIAFVDDEEDAFIDDDDEGEGDIDIDIDDEDDDYLDEDLEGDLVDELDDDDDD